jgi:rieske iron-sulfur protein
MSERYAATGSEGGTSGRSAPAGALASPERRQFLRAALAAGVGTSLLESFPAAAVEQRNARPQPGDRFVFASGEREGSEIAPEDLTVGGPQVLAWPIDPTTKARRDASRLAQVLLVRLDPANLDEATRTHAADGIVAYSATCTHAQCPVTGWNAEKRVFHCQCHQSEYDPRQDGKVVFGPAPRALPALPLKLEDGAVVAAGTFIGRVGAGSA